MKTAVLFSGGIDSVVLSYLIHATDNLGTLILVNYGQTTFPEQHRIMRVLAEELGCDTHVISHDYRSICPENSPEASSPQFTPDFKPTNSYTRDDLTTTMGSLSQFQDWGWLNGRNAMFILLASIYASYNGCGKLVVGTQYNDIELGFAVKPELSAACDTTRHLIDLMNKIVFLSFKEPFLIETPLLAFSKSQVVALGRTLGANLIHNSISCEYYPPCGMCSQCLDRQSVLP